MLHINYSDDLTTYSVHDSDGACISANNTIDNRLIDEIPPGTTHIIEQELGEVTVSEAQDAIDMTIGA